MLSGCRTPCALLQVLLTIPGDMAVTKEDVAAEGSCVQLASGRSELIGLALWLLVQRCKVQCLDVTLPLMCAH